MPSDDIASIAMQAPQSARAATMTGKPNRYVGVDKDIHGAMTNIGRIVRDAWVFGLIDESETCEDWNIEGIDALLQKVNAEWDKYGCLPSCLPAQLVQRHQRIHGAAFAKARAAGWSGDSETRDDQ